MDIIKNLENPSSEYRGHPFWSWNDKLEPEELRHQIREMKRVGLGGYFMHARGGLITEYLSDDWFECIKAGVDEGKKTGMNAWSYDENGWPSGFGGGIVTAMGDRYHVRELNCAPYETKKIDGKVLGFWGVGEKKIRFLGDKIREAKSKLKGDETLYYVAHKKNPCYIDLLNPKVVKEFIKCTYEVYKEKLGDDFGGAMPGFFTDEPQYSQRDIPWSYILPSEFKKTHGYDLSDKLPLLYLDKEGATKFRYDFWMVVSRLYTESFGKQIYDWCEKNGCKLTGHAMAEETLMSQMRCTAGVMPFYQYEHIPGIDKLMREIGNPSTAKQVGSAAKQLGRKLVMTETFAGCGWDVSFEELKWIAEWQFICGVNFICQHLESYSIRGLRKRDWPPSMFYQSPWWDDYKKFNDYISRLGKLIADSDEEADVLLLHPMHTAYAVYNGKTTDQRINYYNNEWMRAMNILANNHIGYHLGDDNIMLNHGSVDGTTFVVGKCRYSTVMMPSIITLDASTWALLKEFINNGGKVYAFGEKPSLVDGAPSEELCEYMKNVPVISNDEEFTIRELTAYGIKKLSVTDKNGEIGNIRLMVNILEDGKKAYFFQNQNKELSYNAKIVLDSNADVVKLALEDMSVSALDTVTENNKTVIYMHFAPMESCIILAGDELPEITVKNKPTFKLPLSREWIIEKCDDNAMTLDKCEYSLDGGETWEGPHYILDTMERLLAMRYSDKLKLRFTFEVDSTAKLLAMKNFNLVSELADTFTVTVNGNTIKHDGKSWWIDKAFRAYDIKKFVKPGINEIIVDGSFHQREEVYNVLFGKNVLETERNKLTYDTELESLYLVGDFGVYSKTGYVDGVRRAIFTEGGFVITDRPTSIVGGNIVSQGYTFFRGNITFSQEVKIKKSYGKHVGIEIPKPYGALAKLYVNGKYVKTMLWSDYTADITDYVEPGKIAKISIEVTVGNRNLLGPHYTPKGETYQTSPRTFSPAGSYTPDKWRGERYCFVKAGLGE